MKNAEVILWLLVGVGFYLLWRSITTVNRVASSAAAAVTGAENYIYGIPSSIGSTAYNEAGNLWNALNSTQFFSNLGTWSNNFSGLGLTNGVIDTSQANVGMPGTDLGSGYVVGDGGGNAQMDQPSGLLDVGGINFLTGSPSLRQPDNGGGVLSIGQGLGATTFDITGVDGQLPQWDPSYSNVPDPGVTAQGVDPSLYGN